MFGRGWGSSKKIKNKLGTSRIRWRQYDLFDQIKILPYPDPIIEDEIHVLDICPLYADLRQKLLPQTRSIHHTEINQIFKHSWTIRDLGKFLVKVNERRFPKTVPKN
jgi:hypothetical protein